MPEETTLRVNIAHHYFNMLRLNSAKVHDRFAGRQRNFRPAIRQVFIFLYHFHLFKTSAHTFQTPLAFENIFKNYILFAAINFILTRIFSVRDI